MFPLWLAIVIIFYFFVWLLIVKTGKHFLLLKKLTMPCQKKKTPLTLLVSQQKLYKPEREWHDIFKVMKGKNLQQTILYPARLSFRFDGEIKSFPDKQKLREFSTTKPALQQMQKEFL